MHYQWGKSVITVYQEDKDMEDSQAINESNKKCS